MTRILAATLLFLPTFAQADCRDLRTIPDNPPAFTQVDEIQLGLRSALDDDNILLSDNWLGSYTKQALVRLCQQVPMVSTVTQVEATLHLADEYGRLAGLVPEWKQLAGDAGFANAILPSDQDVFNINIMALVGAPDGTADWLLDQTGPTDCTDLSDTGLPALARTGQLALTALDQATWSNAAATCTALDLASGAQAATDVLSSLGRIETTLPGGVQQILSPDFALWLGEDVSARGPRLVGSDDAVIALVTDYRAANRAAAPRDYSLLYQTLPASCKPATGALITDYISFDQTALDGLVDPIDVKGLLADLEEQTFDTAADLSQAIDTALTGQVSACTRDQIMRAVNSPDNLGRAFQLNPEKAANLALVPEFAESAPVVAEYIGLTAPSRAALLTGLRANLQTATSARVQAEVEAAADVLAAAAEPMSDTFDTLPEGVPEFEPLEVTPTIGVTDATDSAIAATVTDAEFRAALLGASYVPAPNAEVLKSDARKLLAPIAEDKIATAVNRDMIQILGAVETRWGLTDSLTQAIAAAPATTAIQEVITDPEAAAELTALLGVEYPNARLLDAALAQLSPAPSAASIADIRANASRNIAEPTADYDTAIALPDCGCVSTRDENSEIYSFYPFWFAPQLNAPEDAPPGRSVDFSIVSRAAFYGLEFALSDEGTLVLHNEGQWTQGQRDFVNAAHRHRAQADLAIKLTGWENWSDVQIATAVQKILTLTAPYHRTDTNDLAAWRAAFPYLLDHPQVDGVTLIIDGYDGTTQSVHNIERLISLVTLLYADLEPRDQTINLAFDLSLAEVPSSEPVFTDIKALLTGTNPIVDYVLLFLERPTTDNKKTLRARMENGAFRGIDRARVLRRIIPVLPPAGHEHVLQSPAAGAPADAPDPGPFSQFADDLVYFHDNFAGVGFWPAPDPNAAETPTINAMFRQMWLKPRLPQFLASYQADMDRACTFICPNRAYVAAVAALIFLATALLVWRSFYSGFVDRLAFRLGFAWLGGAGVFAALLALTICDAVAIWPPVLLFMIILGVGFLIAFHIYQGARNGPKP
ncbi:hypothetical protein DS901_06995 [Loktanella sp. D2R18]|uniref:hypothetical protein n=1 Tax=Rhodobacterales TaxID=204455 RepID=UPI000DEA5A47|nr:MULTISPECIES: hypothetical protein [Rhodobacterales]MDO6589515.1 hypothetical protein [Yoonia sp. 1_MG-2023]RBW44163.1 hypothetical protein DS901_06995 [Loktanella sp. D2R18]